MAQGTAPEILHGRWLHSHEEDTNTEMVFRPAAFNFPPSRGRMGFELRPDHSLVEIGIAPTDGPVEATGRWEQQGGSQISFYQGASRKLARVLHIVSADKDRLVVKK
jgi:hypothetical protein